MTWLVVALVAIALIAIGAYVMDKQRSAALRRRFGPEYDRALGEADGDRRAAETRLRDRLRQRAAVDVRDVEPAARERYEARWRALQTGFVDDPAGAVAEAATHGRAARGRAGLRPGRGRRRRRPRSRRARGGRPPRARGRPPRRPARSGPTRRSTTCARRSCTTARCSRRSSATGAEPGDGDRDGRGRRAATRGHRGRGGAAVTAAGHARADRPHAPPGGRARGRPPAGDRGDPTRTRSRTPSPTRSRFRPTTRPTTRRGRRTRCRRSGTPTAPRRGGDPDPVGPGDPMRVPTPSTTPTRCRHGSRSRPLVEPEVDARAGGDRPSPTWAGSRSRGRARAGGDGARPRPGGRARASSRRRRPIPSPTPLPRPDTEAGGGDRSRSRRDTRGVHGRARRAAPALGVGAGQLRRRPPPGRRAGRRDGQRGRGRPPGPHRATAGGPGRDLA